MKSLPVSPPKPQHATEGEEGMQASQANCKVGSTKQQTTQWQVSPGQPQPVRGGSWEPVRLLE